jgi:hypothetical protein
MMKRNNLIWLVVIIAVLWWMGVFSGGMAAMKPASPGEGSLG